MSLQAVLLLRLRQVQEEAEDAGDESKLLEFGVNRVAGARQRDLITWYFDLLADRCGFPPCRPSAFVWCRPTYVQLTVW
jgi:hypothetical protein